MLTFSQVLRTCRALSVFAREFDMQNTNQAAFDVTGGCGLPVTDVHVHVRWEALFYFLCSFGSREQTGTTPLTWTDGLSDSANVCVCDVSSSSRLLLLPPTPPLTSARAPSGPLLDTFPGHVACPRPFLCSSPPFDCGAWVCHSASSQPDAPPEHTRGGDFIPTSNQVATVRIFFISYSSASSSILYSSFIL